MEHVRVLGDSVGLLYRRLVVLRRVLPVVAFFLVLIQQVVEHFWLEWVPPAVPFLVETLIYGALGPLVAWFALTSLMHWVQDQEEAEVYLRNLHEVSRQAAAATDTHALVEMALRLPEQVLGPVATSLIMREHAEAPWMLAGTYRLSPDQRSVLEAATLAMGTGHYCDRCAALAATARDNCPLLTPLQPISLPAVASVICLPLSTARAPLALLNVYLAEKKPFSRTTRRVLESMAAVMAVALDHARLRAREMHVLQQVERAVRQQESLNTTLEHLLTDIVAVQRAEGGAVFLTTRESAGPELTAVAAWPQPDICAQVIDLAHQAFEERRPVVSNDVRPGEQVLAVPLVAEGLVVGVLALRSSRHLSAFQTSFLHISASMMALLVRNSQLHAELESQAVLEERNRLAREVHDGLAQSLGFLNFKVQQVDRLLARGQWEGARRALQELRQGVQDVYGEVRLTIQDLRWAPEGNGGLIERLRKYVETFAGRTGLEVTLEVRGEPRFSPLQEVHLFRVAQEALTNVHKHAHARHVWVRLYGNASDVMLEVEDDGVGLSVNPNPVPGRFGLRIMQERVEAIGGRVSLESMPERGTRLRVTVPNRRLALERR